MQIGNAPCSWGVFYPEGNRIAGPAYLDAVARAGYQLTELGPLGYLGEDAAQLADALEKRGLRLAGASHVHTLAEPESRQALTDTLKRLGRVLVPLGASDLVLMDESAFYPADRPTEPAPEAWQGITAMICHACAVARDLGLTLHLHPHVGTSIEFEAQIDRVLQETEVSLCLDTGHHAFWGQDPLVYLQKVWHRVGFIHLKNVDPVVLARVLAGELGVDASFEQGVMCALSEGGVDIAAVMRFLHGRGYAGPVIVEQDPDNIATPAACEELARRNLAYLKALLS